jgi:hypothetical protein
MKRGRKPKPEVSPEIAAIERLVDDGASSIATIRKRIALIPAERKLDPLETMAMMKMAKDVRSMPVRKEISP